MNVMSEQETKTLQYLRGLKSMSIELPANLLATMIDLENKEKAQVPAPTISHGHINRMNKLNGQINSAAKRAATLDSEWASFMHMVMEKVQMHYAMFKQSRMEAMETYNVKVQEMQNLRQEIAQASQELCSVAVVATVKEEPQEMQAHMQQLAEMAAAAMQAGTINVEDSPELLAPENDEGMDGSVETDGDKPPKSKVKVQAFRAAGSPHRVAQHTLKGGHKDK